MELLEYLKIFRREKRLIISITLITMLAGILFTQLQPPRYETSLSLFMQKSGTQDTTEFKYDGYYALQAESLAADNVAKRLQAPGVVEEIYRAAGLNPEASKIKNFKKKFTATKMMGNYVEVSFTTEDEAESSKLSAALLQNTTAYVESLKSASANEVSLGVKNSEPVTRPANPSLLLITFATLVCGLGLGLLWALCKHYFKQSA